MIASADFFRFSSRSCSVSFGASTGASGFAIGFFAAFLSPPHAITRIVEIVHTARTMGSLYDRSPTDTRRRASHLDGRAKHEGDPGPPRARSARHRRKI